MDFTQIPDTEKAQRLEMEFMERSFAREQNKKLQDKLGLEYRYFRFPHIEGDYRRSQIYEVSVSVGWKKVMLDNVGEIRYAVAFQSKKDLFSRSEARKIINHRWNNGYTISIPIDESFKKSGIDDLIVWHYNNSIITGKQLGTKIGRPSYLKRIPFRRW